MFVIRTTVTSNYTELTISKIRKIKTDNGHILSVIQWQVGLNKEMKDKEKPLKIEKTSNFRELF